MLWLIVAIVTGCSCALLVHESMAFMRRDRLNTLCIMGCAICMFWGLFVLNLWFGSGPAPENRCIAETIPRVTDHIEFSRQLFFITAITACVALIQTAFFKLSLVKAFVCCVAEFGCAFIFWILDRISSPLSYLNLRPYGFDHYHWSNQFSLAFVTSILLLSLLQPIHAKLTQGILQIWRDWFRLNYQWKKSKR